MLNRAGLLMLRLATSHLEAIATAAIDKAAAHPSVATDYDAETRPQGAAPDIGADEFSLVSQAPAAPTNVR